MMARTKESPSPTPCVAIHVTEPGVRTRHGSLGCQIGKNVEFSTASLESYFFARWERVAYDALLVAAAVEFGDRTQRRPAYTWQRKIELRIPVHNPDLWNDKRVADALHSVLDFLTGDQWRIEFYKRRQPASEPRQGLLSLHAGVDAVIPFSNGLDSRAVAGLVARELGERLVRVRLGSKLQDGEALSRQREAFTSVPFHVKSGQFAFVESTARSRGFKFALVSALAAYLAGATQVIIPESGQGALGPALVPVGQAYEDYRSHPLFTGRMERFLDALLGHRVRFSFPRLWYTKAETLRKFVDECEDNSSWFVTWSCWQQSRQVSINHKKRQCGICAACMLRRLSVYAAGLSEPSENYVWEDLSARTFTAGVAASFRPEKITHALREYAIAGALHLDHLAGLQDSPANARMLTLSGFQLSGALGLKETDARAKLDRLLHQHSCEWRNFMLSLGQNSFVADWALSARS
jgi:7-cyano-7-deazaguanine synthase in queuosine biosynthesis